MIRKKKKSLDNTRQVGGVGGMNYISPVFQIPSEITRNVLQKSPRHSRSSSFMVFQLGAICDEGLLQVRPEHPPYSAESSLKSIITFTT